MQQQNTEEKQIHGIDYSTSLEGVKDEELVERVKKNPEEYGFLIARYSPKLTRYIRRISNSSHEDAEDALQEIFLKAYQRINDFDTNLSFSSWIYRIAHNHVISRFRAASSRAHTHAFPLDIEDVARLASSLSVEADAEQAILAAHMQEAMEELSPKYKEVLVLRFFEDQSYESIADILKCSSGTVATRINRAKKKLLVIWQKRLEKKERDDPASGTEEKDKNKTEQDSKETTSEHTTL